MFTSKKGNIPIRITGVFKRCIQRDGEGDNQDNDEYRIWVSANAIVIRKQDLETFSVNFEHNENDITTDSLQFNNDVQLDGTSATRTRGYLIDYDFFIPVRLLTKLRAVKTYIDRDHHRADPEGPDELDFEEAEVFIDQFLPIEETSSPKRKKLVELFGPPPKPSQVSRSRSTRAETRARSEVRDSSHRR